MDEAQTYSFLHSGVRVRADHWDDTPDPLKDTYSKTVTDILAELGSAFSGFTDDVTELGKSFTTVKASTGTHLQNGIIDETTARAWGKSTRLHQAMESRLGKEAAEIARRVRERQQAMYKELIEKGRLTVFDDFFDDPIELENYQPNRAERRGSPRKHDYQQHGPQQRRRR